MSGERGRVVIYRYTHTQTQARRMELFRHTIKSWWWVFAIANDIAEARSRRKKKGQWRLAKIRLIASIFFFFVLRHQAFP